MVYMFVTMSMGVGLISYLNKTGEYSNSMIRKMFHVLAFVLFVPGINFNVRIF
jgi:uncharacterized membrane protein